MKDSGELGFGYEAAKALAFAAIAASRMGQAFEGVKLFAQAKEMFVQDKNLIWPSLIDLYEALVLFNEGRLFEARRLCIAAHEFFRSIGHAGQGGPGRVAAGAHRPAHGRSGQRAEATASKRSRAL